MDEGDREMSGFVSDLIAWFADPAQWTGSDGIPERTLQHLGLTFAPMIIAIAFALPLGLWLGHRRVGQVSVTAIVNIGRAVPSFGLLVLAFVIFAGLGVGLSFWPAVVALVALALPPIFTNSYTAMLTVPDDTVEAARGMGLSEGEVLREVEIPVGSPLILAGVRISLIQVLATVPLAAVVSSGGGLGQYVVGGFARGPAGRVEVFAGAVLIATLTLVVDWLFTRIERLALPEGVRRLSDAEVRAAASIS